METGSNENNIASSKLANEFNYDVANRNSESDDAELVADQLSQSKARSLAIDCEVTQWTQWSSCSATCGRGAESRVRHVLVPPSGGGKRCPYRLAQRRNCRNPYRPHCEKSSLCLGFF